MNEFWLYFKLGLYHVLDWQAYDHILFLVVLTAAYSFKSWKRVFILVSLFTLGHTLSLFLSAYNVISVNSRVVEFLIPLTIFASAVFNIFTAGKPVQNQKVNVLMVTTIFFGLIHGLGFSSYFKTINAGSGSKLMPLIEFALGIELAQIIVVVIILMLSYVIQTVFRFSLRDWVLVVSSIVLGMVVPMLASNWI